MLAATAGLILAASAPLLAQEDGALHAARQGQVTPVDELLVELLSAGPGAAGTLIVQLQDELSSGNRPAMVELLAQIEKLPGAVLQDRQDMPNGALTDHRWARGTGIGLDVIRETGGSEDLLLLRKLTQAPGEIGTNVLALQAGPLENTLRTVLLRQTDAYSAIGSLYRDLPAWAAPSLLRAIAATRSLEGLHALPALLGKRSPLDAYVLTQIASIARFARAPLNDGELNRIRRFLDSQMPEERRNAAQALGFLDDTESIPELIELLKDSDQSVMQSSYSALRLITAMTIDPGYRLWVNWHGRESLWWKTQATPHLSQVRSGRTGGMVVALRELGSKRLFRREIAPYVEPLLTSERDETVRIALSALTSLRANDTATLATMEALLEHPNQVIREQASSSLRLITRREFRPKQPAPVQPR